MASEILTTKILLEAYRSGVFPMAEDRNSSKLFWSTRRNAGWSRSIGFIFLAR